MSMTTPIVDFVRSYAKSGTSRLHMPGHKGQKLLGFEDADITEIKGADELYEAEGIIAESEANATKMFGTAHTYYSTEGSSQCIRAMLCLALQAAPAGQRPVLLAARNAHKALLYAAALLASTSPARTISVGCRTSRPFPRSATPTVLRFWWTTPTART